MAKSVFSIKMDYRSAMNRAKDLENIASRLGENAGNIDDCISEIRSAWQSENADIFAGKTENVRDNVLTVQRNLNRIAEVIRKIATRTYEAEMRAVEIAKKRDY